MRRQEHGNRKGAPTELPGKLHKAVEEVGRGTTGEGGMTPYISVQLLPGWCPIEGTQPATAREQVWLARICLGTHDGQYCYLAGVLPNLLTHDPGTS